MKLFGRRQILKGIAAAPLAAPAAAEAMKLQLMVPGASVLGGLSQGKGNYVDVASHGTEHTGPIKFWDFASWLKRYGERQILGEARAVHGLDPDIIEMRLPLATKVRMQRGRNYERLLAHKKDWFDLAIQERGFMEWWP